jgi:hypothetical protein
MASNRSSRPFQDRLRRVLGPHATMVTEHAVRTTPPRLKTPTPTGLRLTVDPIIDGDAPGTRRLMAEHFAGTPRCCAAS